jgi:UPF0755 protein
VIDGLPPGPIANPGKDSIAAVLHPAETPDLYFVATGKGGHVFAATNDEQAKNVAAYRAFERGFPPPGPAPESRPVQDNGRVESAAVPLPDTATPKLKATKPVRKVRRRRG